MHPQQPRHRIVRRIDVTPLAGLTGAVATEILTKEIGDYHRLQRDLPVGLVVPPDVLGLMQAKLEGVHAYVTDELTRAQGADATVLTALLGAITEQQALVDDLGLLGRLPAAAPAPRLHFCWSGRPIRAVALDTIVAWAAYAQKAGWTVTVWTDAKVREWSSAARARLKTAGVVLADIDAKVVEPRLWGAYEAVIRGPRPNFPAGSDLLRYSVLKKVGGVYVDVDIAPGHLESLQVLAAPVPLLLLGPGIRDSHELSEVGGRGEITPDLVARLATLRLRQSAYNNNFIACPAGSAVMEAVIAKLATMDVPELVAEPSNAAFMTGPGMVKTVLIRHVAQAAGVTLDRAADIVGLALSELPALGWLTAESDNQEH